VSRAALGAGVAALALLLAGVAVASSTPTQYRAQAAAACKVTSAGLAKLAQPKTKAELAPFIKKGLPLFKAQYAKIKQLSPPSSLRTLHLKALSLEKQQIDGLQSFLDQVAKGADPTKTFAATDKKLSPIGDAETATWNKLHVTACANI
jgi:hypothetical protein